MMSDEQRKQEEQELKEMETQLLAEKETKEASVAVAEPTVETHPQSSGSPAEPDATQSEDAPVIQPQETKPDDDAMEWAKAKGYKSPEDMARELLKKDREYHESRNKREREAPPAPPAWAPNPQMNPQFGYQPNYGFMPPPPPNRAAISQEMAKRYGMDPEDVDRLLPMVVDAAKTISAQQVNEIRRELNQVRRGEEKSREMMTLMQDPAFSDPRVQREIHGIIDADPSIQEQPGYLTATFNQAVINLWKKQTLQQSPANGTSLNPPTTAGGGNGSQMPRRQITEKVFDSWSSKEQEAYLNSNGRIVPKR